MQERKTCFVFHQGKLEEEIEKANEKKKKKKKKKERKKRKEKSEKRDQRGRGNYSMAKSRLQFKITLTII